MDNLCTICGAPGIPGLVQGAGKCQYHWNVGQYGEAWANRIRDQKPIPPHLRGRIRALMKIAMAGGNAAVAPHVHAAMRQPDWSELAACVIDGPYDDDLAALRAEVWAEIDREKKE